MATTASTGKATTNESIMPCVNALYINSEIRGEEPSCYDYAKRDESDSDSYLSSNDKSMSSGSYYQDDDDNTSYYSSDDYSVSSDDCSNGSTDEDYSDEDDYTADGDYSTGDY